MRFPALKTTLRVLLAGALVVLAWTVVVVLSVRDDLADARAALEAARSASEVDALEPLLQRAESELDLAVGRLRQPGPALFAAVPVLGRSVEAVTRTGEAALAVTRGTRGVVAATEAGGPLLADGRLDLARLAEVEAALTRAATDVRAPVDALRDQPLGLVPAPVTGPARTAQQELRTVPDDLAAAAAGVRALRDLLGGNGPRELLVMLENNAELRGTGGVVTVFAEATAEDGRLDVRAFRDVEDVADPAATARRVPVAEEFRSLYGAFKADTTLWKNANMSPDVPTSSRVLADVAEASTGRRPDAVLWFDVPTIAAVLRATGPARLPDGTLLTADGAVQALLSTAYRDAPDTPEGQSRRRAVLRGAADAVLGDLLGAISGGTSPTTLARELSAAAQGRHLALWSADAAVQADLAAAGLDGAVRAGEGDLSSFTVHNLGDGGVDGNKLDYYGRRLIEVDVTLGQTAAQVRQRFTLRNTAPAAGLPAYVAGRRRPGVSNSLVTMAVPAAARDLVLLRAGRGLAVTPQPEGDHLVLTDTASLPPGASTSWELRYDLPVEQGRYAVSLLPQPLAVDAGLALTVRGPADRGLVAPGLTAQPDGTSGRSGPFDRSVAVEVHLERRGVLGRSLEALRRFWSEPVTLG